jgi:hypothetical protein
MKFILDFYFKIFRWLFNKLPIPTNKTGKNNWDWLKLDKNETFTKVLGAIFFYGITGYFLMVAKFIVNNYVTLELLSKLGFNAINGIAYLKLKIFQATIVWFVSWLITMLIILKNHKKKLLIKPIK